MFDCVNYINNQKFVVNLDLMNYLDTEDGAKILSLYYTNFDVRLNNLITLEIAKTFRDTVFYLNSWLD